VFKQDAVSYSIFLLLFSRYFGELNPTAFLLFYYFLVSYIFSSLIVVLFDLAVIIAKNRMKK
jgi:hypothetical protein